MGLAGFNRMRRERAPESKMEAERFDKWNQTRHANAKAARRADRENREALPAIREENLAASQRIGEKVLEGIREGEAGGVIDGPLRRDHAAEITGRNLHDVQKPKSPVQRVEDRIPTEKTVTEELVDHLQVDKDGPSAELVEAARVETGAIREPDAAAPGSGESVAPEGGEGAATGDEENTDAEGEGTKKRRVAIAHDWQSLDAEKRKALAGRISGEEVTLAKDADKIIRDELASRG
jgi:hypothetical protein